ncbi:MAG: hypothetical protein HQ564_06420, partial [Candidatus Saganbacteria bacterium]|nr:hypothetical protein [Candidatus Saganbacteria bacterium]
MGPLDPLKKADSGAARPAGKGLAKPPVKTKGTGVQAPPKANKPAPGQKANASRQNQILSSPFSKYKGILFSVAFPYAGVDREYQQTVFTLLEQNLNNPGFIITDQYINGEKMFEKHQLVNVYQHMLETLGIKVEAGKKGLIGKGMSKGIQDFKILLLAQGKNLPENESIDNGNFSPAIQKLLIAEYANLVGSVKKWVGEFAPQKDRAELVKTVLELLSGKKGKMFLFDLGEIGTKIRKITIATTTDGKVKKSEKKSSPLYDLIKFYLARKYRLDQKKRENAMEILNKFSLFQKEKGIVKGEEAKQREKIYQVGKYLRGEMGKRRGRKQKPVPPYLLSAGRRIVNNARAKGYTSVILGLSKKQQLAPGEIPLGRQMIYGELVRMIQKNIKGMNRRMVIKAIGVAYTLIKFKLTYSELILLDKVYSSLGDLNGTPLILTAETVKEMVQDYSGRKIAWKPKLETQAVFEAAEEVEIDKYIKIPDLSRICALKSVIYNRGYKASPNIETLDSHNIRAIVDVFSSGGWMINTIFRGEQLKAMEAAEKWKELDDDSKTLLKKIVKMQYGVSSLYISAKDLRKIKKLIQKLKGIEKAGGANMFEATVIMEALKELEKPGNLLRLKVGLSHKEVRILHAFADALKSGKFIKVENRNGDLAVKAGKLVSLVDPAKGNTNILFKEGLEVLNKLGWQLSEIMPQMEEKNGDKQSGGFLAFIHGSVEDFKEGLGQVSAKQMVKVSGVEDHVIMTFRALTYGKNQAIFKQLKALYSKLKANKKELKELKKKHGKLKGDGELLKKNPVDYDKYKALLLEARSIALQMNKLARKVFSSRVDLPFLRGQESVLKRACKLINLDNPILEGYLLTDQTGKAIKIPDVYKFIYDTLKADGGRWETSTIIPGEPRNTTMAKKLLALAVYNTSLFQKCVIHKGAALLGGLPVAGMIPNLALKGTSGVLLNTEASYEFGVQSDDQLLSYLPHDSKGRFLFKARMFASNFIEIPTNQKANMSPYLYLLLSSDAEDRIEMLMNVFAGGKKLDVINNIGTIDAKSVRLARTYFEKLERRTNELLKGSPKLYKKLKDDISKDPMMKALVEFDDKNNSFKFKKTEALDKLEAFAKLIKDKRVVLYHNSQQMEQGLRDGAAVLNSLINIAFKTMGCCGEKSKIFSRPAEGLVSSQDVTEGWKRAQKDVPAEQKGKILRSVGQEEGLSVKLWDTGAHILTNPVSSTKEAFRASLETGVFFALMPAVFSYQFSQWAGRLIDAVSLLSSNPALARKKFDELLTEIQKLAGAVTGFSFNPLAFWYMVKEAIDAKQYGRAMGIAVAVARFAIYVAKRDYYLVTNGLRWVAGKPTIPMGWSLLNIHVRGLVWGVKQGAEQTLGRLWGHESRYEAIGRPWDRTISPWLTGKKQWAKNNTMGALKWLFKENSVFKGIGAFFSESYSNSGPVAKFLLGRVAAPMLGISVRGLETLGDAYWNGILAHRWSNKVWGGLSYVSRGFSDWAIFAPGRHADWESRMADLNKKVDDASRKVGVVDIYRTNRAGGDRTKAYRRSGPQAEMLVESGALYGVKLSSFEGDPRNAIFKSKLAKALESLGKGRPKINGIPIERIQIVKGKQIGYLTLNFEGNKGIELRIGQELLTESPETIAKYIEGLSKLDKNVGRSRVVEAERTKGKKGDVKKPSEVEVRPGESVASTAKIIDGLIPEMGKLTYEELTGLTKKVKAEFSRALAGRKITDLSNEELVELMDTTKIEFNGKKYTLLELRLAQAREIVKRYTTREFKNESYLPRKVFDAARKSVRKSGSWKKFTMAEGKILTTVQIQAILSMHKGLGAQFLMGQGKTNVIGALQIVNSVLGRQMYSTSHSNLDSKASYYEQRLFLKAAGIKTGFVDYHNSNFDAVRQTFQKNELVYLSQSDLTFIHLINRTIPEGWQRVPIDFKKGIFAVDEYDFILVDQGQTPHIISDMNSAEVEDSRAWRNASKAVGSLKEGVHYQRSAKGEFEILEKDKRVFRSERGFARKWDDLSEKQRHRITKCLEARYLVPGKDYVISHVRGMIVIIDKNTGQLSRGTEWSDGLHQAVQAKHLSTQYGKITSPMQTLESITASEFGKLMRWKVGCSGTLIQIAELLGREGIGIVDIPSVVPPLDIDAEVAKRRTVEQITKTALDIVARTSLEVTFSYDIQLEFSPKNRAVAEAVMDALRLKNNSKGDAISPSWKNRHNERVYRNWVTQRDAMVADIETETENAKTTHTSKKARAIVIVIEDPLKAKNLFEQLSSKLKGSKLTFLDHSDEVRYQQVFGRELQRGEVIVTTLARRGTDPQPADKEGLILYIGDRAENSWGQLQKEGRWPRVGKNGELRLFSSLDEGVYHSEVGIDKAVELIDKTGLSEILRNSLKARLVNLKAGNVSYADLLALSGQGDAFKLAAFEGEITFEDAVKLLGEAKSLDPALQMGLIKKLLAIKMGNMSYSDLIQIVMQKNNNHATDIENIINAAQGDSDEKTFDREFKMRKLSTIKENADALLDKLRDRYQVAGSRGIIEDVIRRQVEALAEKHGIKDGGKWDIKGFNESIKELFGLKEVDITIEARPGERARVNAKGFIDAVRAKLVKRYLSEKSQGRMGIDSHQEKMMKYFLFQNFKDAEMGLRRAWERLTRKLDTVLEGAMAKVVDGEVVLKMTGEQKTAFELLQKEYNDAVKDILMLSERKAISEVVKRTRSNWLVKWATKGRGYNRPDGKLRIRILATVSAPSGAPEAPRSEGPRPRPLRAPSGPTSNPALQLNESQYKELAKDGITQNDRQLIVRGEEGKYYEVTLGKGVRYSKGLDGKFYISRGGGQTGFNGVSELISAINSGRGLGAQISSVDISRPTAVLKKHGLNAFDGMMIPFEMIKKVVPLEDVLFIPETLAPGVKRTSDGTIKIDGAKVKDFHQALKLANDAIHVVYEGAEKIKVRFYRGEIKTFTEARALLESIYSWSGAADIEGKGIKQERKTEVDEALSSKTLKRLSRRSIFHRGGAGASEVITFSTGQKATITVSAKNTVTIRFHEDGQEVKVSRRELTILAKGERVWKNLLRRTSRMNKKYSPSDVTEGVYIALTENGNLADSQRYSNKVRVSLIRLEGVSDVKSAQELARMILLEAASEIGKVNKKLGEAFKTAIKGLSLPELSKLDPSEILTLASMLESRRHRIRFNSQTENWVRGILEKAGLPKAAVTETIARLRW